MDTEVLITTIKYFGVNFCTYLIFVKSINYKNTSNRRMIAIVISFFVAIGYVILCSYMNNFFSLILSNFIFSMLLGVITKNKKGYSILITILSLSISLIMWSMLYAMMYITQGIPNFTEYHVHFFIAIIEPFIVHLIFKIKRLRNGFSFLQNKDRNDYINIFIINVSIFLLFVYFLIGKVQDDVYTNQLYIAFIVFTVTLIIGIQNTFILYQKQKSLTKELFELKEENANNLKKIEKLSQEKYEFSKRNHEFYNRMKAIEYKVNNTEFGNEMLTENEIKKLTNEYTESMSEINKYNMLTKTEIDGIDRMFVYMQAECKRHNINFMLEINGYIHSLIKNIIPQNKLETLIGDHIKDAIIAVNSSKFEHRNILVKLGLIRGCYEFSVFDTGIDFQINALLKLGLEPVTTYETGTGYGFMSTFEVLKECKASLYIEENKVEKVGYSKVITIRFDKKHLYKIRSHRAEQIKLEDKENRIIIENL